ncbi:hypothetical protein ABZ896_01800, partial [Streptomyces sp. NPDC047072]|uniref:hypothetical protein n=1 Tax=Streptomyces sp. NPDC047072 TaxID=3154809 RepID=UPI0033E2F444
MLAQFPAPLGRLQWTHSFSAEGEGDRALAEPEMFAVCRSYGLDRCEPNVTFTLLSISYQP